MSGHFIGGPWCVWLLSANKCSDDGYDTHSFNSILVNRSNHVEKRLENIWRNRSNFSMDCCGNIDAQWWNIVDVIDNANFNCGSAGIGYLVRPRI